MLFNKSISTGHFPESFKVAEITPILKKSSLDASIVSNYRPISNLPFLSKLLERAVNDQLQTHLEAANLLPECQSAYRRSHSTETALLSVTSDALMAADRGMMTILGFLDLSGGVRLCRPYDPSSTASALVRHWFDRNTMDHVVLQRSLVSSSLQRRPLRVVGGGLRRASGINSRSKIFPPCIPRMCSLSLNSTGSSYMDMLTTSRFTSTVFPKTWSTWVRGLTKCVENIESWMSSNRLRLNVTKTEFLWLGSPTRLASNPPSSIQITGSSITPSKTVRSLGVLIDPAISFREQIAGFTNTCYYHLRQLRSIRRSLSFDSSHALIRALILSRLDYCNGLLGGASAALLDQMNGVMRASARFILQKSRSSHITDEMNTRLHWLDIKARIDYKLLCVTTFRCLNGLAPRYLARHCTLVSSVAGRSHLRSAASGMLVVPACSTKTIGPRAFAVSGPCSWNNLPVEMRSSNNSLASFKKELKTVLFIRMLARQQWYEHAYEHIYERIHVCVRIYVYIISYTSYVSYSSSPYSILLFMYSLVWLILH